MRDESAPRRSAATSPSPRSPATSRAWSTAWGGRLFERLPNGVRPTALGATVAEHARRVLHELETAEEAITAREFVAGRSAEDLAPFRRLEAILREAALGRRG